MNKSFQLQLKFMFSVWLHTGGKQYGCYCRRIRFESFNIAICYIAGYNITNYMGSHGDSLVKSVC